MRKITAALLAALMLALSLATLAAEPATPPVPEDPVLATVNGIAITRSQVEAQIPGFLDAQYISDPTAYRAALDILVRRELLAKKITDMGFDQFTKEEEDAFAGEAAKQWEEAVNYYTDYFQSADTTQAREAARQQALDLFAAQGITQEMVLQDVRENASMDRMKQYLLGGYQPGEEEVQKVFQDVGAQYQQSFQNDIPQYEYMTQYSGQSSWYTPEGYRGIIHILLSVDEALLKNYQSLSAALEEQQQSNGLPVVEDGAQEAQGTAAPADGAAEATAQPVTQQMVDEARQAVLDSRKADIDMIYQRLDRGENFLDLIKEYGEDPGMTDAANLENGYPVHAQSILFDPVFTAAAFSEKMKAPGDVSDPVVGSYGIHILQYLRDVPSGLILTDAIRQEIEEYLLAVKLDEVFGAAFETWTAQEQVVYNQAAIDEATAQAQQMVQSPEELPLEAVPDPEDKQP